MPRPHGWQLERRSRANFVHNHADWADLLQVVAKQRNLAPGLVEKDYWVTHTLWALHAAGLDVWFKGGTALSKGFGLIERFSEDLDLKIEPGTVRNLAAIDNWTSEGTHATSVRRTFFEALPAVAVVPGAHVALDPDTVDKSWRSANLHVTYPGRFVHQLGDVFRPFVLLEVGSARVVPCVERALTSFVHDYLESAGQLGDFTDNRPRAVRCVHPLVTLLEKLDALQRRVCNEYAEPASFVRHFEDAARIIANANSLPPLIGYSDARALAEEMLEHKPRQIKQMPTVDDPAFQPDDTARWQAIRQTWRGIAPMFWGRRIPVDVACADIREWIRGALGSRDFRSGHGARGRRRKIAVSVREGTSRGTTQQNRTGRALVSSKSLRAVRDARKRRGAIPAGRRVSVGA